MRRLARIAAFHTVSAPPSVATLPAGLRPRRGAAGGGGIGWARLAVRVGAGCLLLLLGCLRALRPARAMGNCHTVGPNEALVVSGEGAAREVGGGCAGRMVLEGVGVCAWEGG